VPQEETGSRGHRGVVTMRSDNAAGGYATALAELAQSSDNLEAIHKDIDGFGDILKNPEIHEFLVSPVVRDEKKKSILKTLADDAKFHPYTLNFFYVLIDKKRFGLINDIVKEFSTIYYELTDTQLATVASAVKIEKAQLALIAKKIQTLSGAKNVRIKNVIDPSLIAGFIVKYGKDGSCFVDMSVKGQLDRLAQQFEYAERVGAF
jgi:F-type H+-transporting ATPase subunit delta